MISQEFKYWLSGYLALSDENYLNRRQVEIIKDHAALVEATVGNNDPDIQKFLLWIQQEFEQKSRVCIQKIKENFSILRIGSDNHDSNRSDYSGIDATRKE